MKKRKNTGLDNPVLHFGSDVARDLIGDRINGHFKAAFLGLKQYETQMHKGMFEAMRDNRQPAEIRKRLVLNNKVPVNKINSLVRRYVLILDTEWRRTNFLNGTKTFWEASARTRGDRPNLDRLEAVVYAAVICCEKQSISNEQFHALFDEARAQYRQDHGWV